MQIWVQQIDQHTGVFRGVQIFEHEGGGQPRLVMADSATVEYRDGGAIIMMRLRHGENHILDKDDPQKFFRIRFQNQDLAIRNVDDRLERQERKHRGDREMPVEMMLEVAQKAQASYDLVWEENMDKIWDELRTLDTLIRGDTLLESQGFAELPLRPDLERSARVQVQSWERARHRNVLRVVERLTQEKKRVAQYWVEIHKKFSIPVACVIFVLVGAPLGIMARRGGIGTGVIYSLLFFIIYWVALIGGENLADRLIISPEFAMWSSNVLIGVFGVFVTWLMVRDRYTGNKFWHRWQIFRRKNKKEDSP